MYCIQHCFICRPSDSTVSEDAGIEKGWHSKLQFLKGSQKDQQSENELLNFLKFRVKMCRISTHSERNSKTF